MSEMLSCEPRPGLEPFPSDPNVCEHALDVIERHELSPWLHLETDAVLQRCAEALEGAWPLRDRMRAVALVGIQMDPRALRWLDARTSSVPEHSRAFFELVRGRSRRRFQALVTCLSGV